MKTKKILKKIEKHFYETLRNENTKLSNLTKKNWKKQFVQKKKIDELEIEKKRPPLPENLMGGKRNENKGKKN